MSDSTATPERQTLPALLKKSALVKARAAHLVPGLIADAASRPPGATSNSSPQISATRTRGGPMCAHALGSSPGARIAG